MFNIFLDYLFLEDESNCFANYADDTTPLVGGTKVEVLENQSFLDKKLFSWFAGNQLKKNDNKCHLFLSSPEEVAVFK